MRKIVNSSRIPRPKVCACCHTRIEADVPHWSYGDRHFCSGRCADLVVGPNEKYDSRR